MAKQSSENSADIEIYVAQQQLGYNRFRESVVITDGEGTYKGDYSVVKSSRAAEQFYDAFIKSFIQKERKVELHFNGLLNEIVINRQLDGYWGRPKILLQDKLFTRKLTPGERAFLQKQFDRLNEDSGLQLLLVE